MTESDAIPRDRPARLVLALFCVALLVFACFLRTHGAASVDVRTYIEMFVGVAKNGLPYLDNGPIDQFKGLQAPWGISAGGHLWGMYGPVYAYFAAPFFRIGGMVLVSRVTFALLVPIALATFALGRRLIGSERPAVAAAILTVVSTPLLAKGVEPTAYPLAVLLVTLATLCTLVAVVPATAAEGKTRRRIAFALGGGALGGLAGGSHLLCVPMAMSMMATLFLCDAASDASARSLVPNGEKAQRAGAFFLGFVASVAPVALLNAVRFHSFNPFSYGPAPWRLGGGIVDDTMRAQLAFALPTFGFLAVVAGAMFLARRRKLVVIAVLGAAALALFAAPKLQAHVVAMAKMACAMLIDIRPASISEEYAPPPGTFGASVHGHVVKSILEATPFLLVAFIQPRLDARTKHRLLCVLAPAVALLTYMLMRANLPLVAALGRPFIGLRYVLPALPMLIVTAWRALRDVRLSFVHWLVASIIAVVMAAVLWPGDDDRTLWRHVVLLLLPLATAILAAMATFFYVRRGKLARTVAWCLVPSLGVGVGLAVGHDFKSNYLVQLHCDERIDTFAALVPERLAVLGFGHPMQGVLPLRATRDVQFADLDQWEDVRDAKPLVDHWRDEGRPMFFVRDGAPWECPWPGYTFVLIDGRQGFYRVVDLSGQK